MIKSLTLTAKLLLNVHDMNNEATAGNVSDIRMMDYIDLDGLRHEAPAVSGRMMKHWHLANAVRLGNESNLPMCTACKATEPIRPSKEAQKNPVKDCFICDAHGYLVAEKETIKRNSRICFSWLMPTLEKENTMTFKQVIHNRVTTDPKDMMPFHKSYASGRYAFVAGLDCERIGYVDSELQYAISDSERIERIIVLIESFRFLLTGKAGASQSHAMPHSDLLELAVVLSSKTMVPNPVSAIYPDYLEKTAGLVPKDAKVLTFGSAFESNSIVCFNSLDKLFSRIMEENR